jgi:hypothetical protein
LLEANLIEFRPSKGYFAMASQSEALKVVWLNKGAINFL